MFSGKIILLVTLFTMMFQSTASAETVNGYDGSSYSMPYQNLGKCTRWFLFFCIAREGGQQRQAQTTSYRRQYSGNQSFEPAMTQHIPARNAPILGPFNRAFQQCCPGGTYTSLGIWGDARHQRRRSCHNSGSAIDISAVRCPASGTARAGTQKFRNFVRCMGSREGLYTIHGVKDHYGHVDIALRSCQKGGVGKIRVR